MQKLNSWETFFPPKTEPTQIKAECMTQMELPQPLILKKGGGNREPFILIGSTQANAFVGDGSICCTLTEAMGKGGGQIPMIGEIEPINTMPDGTCRTIKNQYYKTSQANFERSSTFGATGVTDGFRIRKLTPKECFRLMGFDDADVDLLVANGISNTQLYKMAGNSIVVNVLEFLFCQIFDSNNEIWV